MTEFTGDYTGRLRSDGNGGVVGWLVDKLGCRIELRGIRDPHGGGYLMTGEVRIPAHLQLDGEEEAIR